MKVAPGALLIRVRGHFRFAISLPLMPYLPTPTTSFRRRPVRYSVLSTLKKADQGCQEQWPLRQGYLSWTGGAILWRRILYSSPR
jgi:hypothetical protein